MQLEGELNQPVTRALPARPKPPASLRVFVIIYWLCVAAIAAMVIKEIVFTRGMVFIDMFWIGSRCIFALALFLAWHAVRKLLARRFLASNAGFVCPGCHYPMRGLSNVGACPECGISYTRAEVLATWENAYKLGTRYPREAQVSQPRVHQPIATTPMETPTPPWTRASLRSAIDQVTTVAKSKGFDRSPYGAYSLDIDQNIWRVQRVIPTDLHAFYMWLDVDLWNAFVSARTGETTETRDTIIIRPPSLFRTRTPKGELIPEPPEPTAESAPIVPSRDPVLVEFADTASGSTLAYCLGTDVPPHGAICVVGGSWAEPVVLAASLAAWLSKMAICDGVDPLVNADGVEFAKDEWREALKQEVVASQARTESTT